MGGEFILRIEDIDQGRARPEWEDQIYDDLHWLGLNWETPVMRQSDRITMYQEALSQLWLGGFLYPCVCNRRDVLAAASAPQDGTPAFGPDGVIYPGTCRPARAETHSSSYPVGVALRLNMARAFEHISNAGAPAVFEEIGEGDESKTGNVTVLRQEAIEQIGDVVLARKDMGTSYHLSVVIDDAAQGITQVVRGGDLFEATKIHVVLQRLLGLPTPLYHHHRLIKDNYGKRLAKRDDARAIQSYRNDGLSPADIRRMVGLQPETT